MSRDWDGDASRPLGRAHWSEDLTAHDRAVLHDLDALLCETYQLWDQDWVGFSWRNYTYDHVRRVQNLALSLAAEEGGQARALAFAAVLHDITKSYDGEVELRDGQRVVDQQGLWRNAFLPPSRTNAVTRLYEMLNLAGTVHHVSGAQIADALLAERGYPATFRAHVGEIIVSHLKVTAASSLEGRCLYDADTIDANIGLPALYRNVQISLHRLEQQYAERGTALDPDLGDHLHDLVRNYVCERWPAWVAGKQRDFVARMTTEAGRRRAQVRVERLGSVLAVMRAEVEVFDVARVTGYLAPVIYFMQHRRNPSLSADLAVLETRWPQDSAPAAARFVELVRRESAGAI
jgi:hypothetical protein